jgi:hypothetical protein
MPLAPNSAMDYIYANRDLYLNFLLEIEIQFGTSEYLRYCLDSSSLLTDSGSKTWTPWPIDFEDLVQRLTEIDPVLQLQIFDPDDIEAGTLKRLVQSERILSRSICRIWMVIKDPNPNTTVPVTGPTTINGTLEFASDTYLRFGDKINLKSTVGTPQIWTFEVTGHSGNNILIDNSYGAIPYDASMVVEVPYYKDSSTWIKYFEGTLDATTMGENTIQLSLKTNNDKLKVLVPKVRYSLHCPYITGDSNCTFFSSPIVTEAVGTIVSYSGKTLVVSMVGATINTNNAGSVTWPPVGGFPFIGKPQSERYWAGGGAMILSGNARGVVRGIRDCAWDGVNNRFTLTLDRTYTGSVTAGTVRLLPSCSRTPEDCTNRFSNENNYGGQSSLIRSVGGLNVVRRLP